MNVLSRRSKVKPNVSPMVSEAAKKTDCSAISLADVVKPDPVVAYADEPLRVVAQRMAQTGLTRFPVIERREERRKQPRPMPGIGGHGKLVGVIGLADLLKGRVLNLEAERNRERVLPIRVFFPLQFSGPRSGGNGSSVES